MKNKKLSKLQNKKIAFLGLGMENHALIKFLLAKKIKCLITICEYRSKEELGDKFKTLDRNSNVSWQFGEYENKHLDGFDILFRSPGWPLFDPAIKEAIKMGVRLSSPIRLFFSLCPTKNIIGVTGTKGKGTTASLIYHILKQAKRRVWLGGNIGVAPFTFFRKIKKNDWVVLELSSFQLEGMKVSPHIAVITNFTREHLAPADPHNPNYHKNMLKYWQAKANIIKWQKRGDRAIINKRLKNKCEPLGNSKKIYFYKSDLKSKLVGEHNKENIAAALEVAKIIGIKQNIIEKGIMKFRGLEHRIEFIKEVKGVTYWDDSFATTPEAAITAIRSFNTPVILLAGGAEKGSDFKLLTLIIKKYVKFVVLFNGEATSRIKKELLKTLYLKNKMKLAFSMKEAVKIAKKNAEPKDVVLLAPACASFGMFRNYKERGDLFKQEVRKIK